MRIQICIIAFGLAAFSALPFSACASPPTAVASHVGVTEKRETPVFAVESPLAFVQITPTAYFPLSAGIVESTVGGECPMAAVAPQLVPQNCSKPQCAGLAIRRRCSHSNGIHLVIVASSGHKLLHIDPGLC